MIKLKLLKVCRIKSIKSIKMFFSFKKKDNMTKDIATVKNIRENKLISLVGTRLKCWKMTYQIPVTLKSACSLRLIESLIFNKLKVQLYLYVSQAKRLILKYSFLYYSNFEQLLCWMSNIYVEYNEIFL